MNVLLTSASRKVGLVKAFQQAVAAEGGGSVVAVDSSPGSPALHRADRGFLVPDGESPEFLACLLDLCQKLQIRLLVPTRDEELPLFAKHRDEFETIGTTVLVAQPRVIDIAQDKHRFVLFCQQHALPVPRTYEQDELRAPKTFPLFVRPRRGRGGHGAQRVSSMKQLELILEIDPDSLVQDAISAPEYTIDLFTDFEGQIISVVPRRRLVVVGGESFVSRTTRNPLLISEACRLARAMGLTGHNTIQCFLDGSTVRFIEVNPRFGGAASLGFMAGAPTPLFLLRLLNGQRVEPRIGDFEDDYVMLRYTEDLYLPASELPRITRW